MEAPTTMATEQTVEQTGRTSTKLINVKIPKGQATVHNKVGPGALFVLYLLVSINLYIQERH